MPAALTPQRRNPFKVVAGDLGHLATTVVKLGLRVPRATAGGVQQLVGSINDARKRRAAAPVAATESGSVGVRATRRRGKRFTGAKKDPTTVRGAARFIAMGVPLICIDCDAEETSYWCGSKADANKPVCKTCYTSQVRRAYHSLASIVCILSALPVFIADAYVMFLHSSPPPAATAFAARSPVRTRA